MKLTDILTIQGGVTAIIGGGGKTTMMHRLARELSEKGTVIITTSTHILTSKKFHTIVNPRIDDVERYLKSFTEEQAGHPVLCIGGAEYNAVEMKSRKLGPSDIDFEQLKTLADYVLVEADGSRGLPMKAHGVHEPVIPECASLTILVVGADGFGEPIHRVCHRPEIYESLVNQKLENEMPAGDRLGQGTVTPLLESIVIEQENLGDIVFVNKCETDKHYEYAYELSGLISKPVYAGSLLKGEYRCLR